MSSLTDLIETIRETPEESVEDIFSSAQSFLFPNDVRNLHGDHGTTIVYKSKRFGNISLLTADPDGEEERKLFSHYLWNAGILMAERISGNRLLNEQERMKWSVEGQTVLELGAGVGLAGIVARLAGAKEVFISDYPAPVVLANIKHNVQKNIPEPCQDNTTVQGHEWGVLNNEFAKHHRGYFSRVMAADCFWMPWQHQNLAQSMLHFLDGDPDARVLAIGGFHSGRANLASFFATAEEEGLFVDDIYEEDDKGTRRVWQVDRNGGMEDVMERKKWLCIARLRKRIESTIT